MTLRISLRDGEKMIVNGAVIRSVGRTDLCLENRAAILRGREVMSPDDATTPARKLYFAAMMAYIDPEGLAAHQERIVALLRELMATVDSDEARVSCVSFARKVAETRFYRALADCRDLIGYEAAVRAEPEPKVA